MSRTAAATPQIAILGAGIGGLATAGFLHRAGLEFSIYEQAAELTETGAGLVVAPNAVRLLRRLGVLEGLLQHAVQLEVGWEFRRWQDGTVLSAEDLASVCQRLYGEQTYTAHRADLLAALRSAVPDGALHLRKRCTSVSVVDGRARMQFADGEVVEPDVLIGADGVHSVVRAAIADPAPPAYSGLCAFRALVPAEHAPSFARRPAQTLWIGPDHHLVHYPVSDGRYVNLVAFAPAGDFSVESWTATATVEELLAEFDGWDPRLLELIEAAGTPGRWALLDRAPLAHWGTGAVTLLGDAAHPMFPFFAQGAAQAIEDAATVTRCLNDDIADPARALRRYEGLRQPRTTRLQEVSHARSLVNHLPDGPEQEARDRSFADADPLLLNGWIYGHDADLAIDEVMSA
jgi:salicylate hydroxylase